MTDFELRLVNGNEPPVDGDISLRECGVCNEIVDDRLEACADCYSRVSNCMDLFQQGLDHSGTARQVCSALGVTYSSEVEDSPARHVWYTATAKGLPGHPVGRGLTIAGAVASLFATLWLDHADQTFEIRRLIVAHRDGQ